MNLKNVVLCVFGLGMAASGAAQVNILNAKTPEDIGKKTEAQIAYDNDTPLPYGYTDERDVLWSKTTWEIIDLDERVN
ncbi:MAG TPA: gliding motility protein GldN, partial [Aequorivita sp.]|nr:gliding motility protein GldN [Aequorivita sp.]